MAFFFLFFGFLVVFFLSFFWNNYAERSDRNIIFKPIIMFQLKTYRQGMKIQKHSFFILNKGLNSGKPMNEPCPNCFVCTCPTENEKQKMYWLLFALWQSKEIEYQLIGSVIPFIRIRDLEKIIKQKAQEHILSAIQEHIPVLFDFQKKEQEFLKKSKQISLLKTSFLRSLVR